MTTRVASLRLIGRADELAALESALADADAGRPSLAFVAGESGVGKTRLVDELMRRARDAGTLVLAGETVGFGGESELPYLPLVAALRPLARSGDAALTPELRAAVAPLLPGVGAPGGGDHGSQARVFEGLLSLIDALGRERPVLLVIEDLHWADRSTREALAFLARSLTSERALIVASYRTDELHRRHPLRSFLAELDLDPRTRRVLLDPLSRDELAALVTDILGDPPAPDLLERLWTRSGGNPLFGEELLAAGREGRGAAPDTLRDALMLRVERLSDPAREVLSLLAVGQRLDHRLLEDTSGLDARALRDALREAVDAHIVVASDDGLYQFRHALLREVVEDDLLPGERAERHLVLARALEPRLADGADAQAAAAVAHHYAASGDRPAALAAAVRAATAAERVHAHGEAAALLERALELWDHVPDAAERAGADRVALLVRAAEAAGALGNPGRRLALLEAAFAALGPEPDPRRAAPILEATARAQRHLNRAPAGIATLERALELIDRSGGDGDPAARAGVLAELARSCMLVGHSARAIRVAHEALETAQEAGLPSLVGHARNTLGFSLAMRGAVDEGLAELRAAIQSVRERDDLSDMAQVFLNCAEVLHRLGRSDEARAAIADGRTALADRRPVATQWFDMRMAEIAFDTGDWAVAEASVVAPHPWLGTQTRVGIALRRASLALARGDHAAARELLHELEPMAADSGEPQVLAQVGVAAAELRRREGDLEGAREAVGRWLERLAFCRDDVMGVTALAAAGAAVEADTAERARDLGDAGAETGALRRLDELLARADGADDDSRPVERAALLGARADRSRAAGRPDPEGYARAAAAWDELGRPEPAARMRWRQAEALAATGDREAAAEAARAAHSAAVGLGAGWLRGEVEGLAVRARLGLAPDRARGDRSEHDEDAFGLTARERQVLALLAEGATNREIGATLFMAEKTASVHVSRILTKLGARTRTEAATVAHRHRLLSPGAE
jgi:DNA-binding CsgD family transcriptional regulator